MPVERAVVRLLLKLNTLFDIFRPGDLLDIFEVYKADLSSLVGQEQPCELLRLATQKPADLLE